MHATIWTNAKIDFINYLAEKWGGKIKDRKDEKCRAPRQSSALEDIARCNKIQFDDIYGIPSLRKSFETFIEETNTKVTRENAGTINIFNNASLQLTIDDLVAPCSQTEGDKEWRCKQ